MSSSLAAKTTSPKPTVRKFLELIRFSHTLFALPFAALSSAWACSLLFRGDVRPSAYDLVRLVTGLLVCMVAARSFAMAVNRWLDQDFDAKNPRTARRHLPAGELNVLQVQSFAFLCAVLFIASTLLFLPNYLPVLLSVPVLVWLAGYSLAKRWTVFAHMWLGIALGLAPVCAWIAIRGSQVAADYSDLLPASLLGLAVVLWVSGFDLIYACQDTEIDRKLGLKSIPAWLGNAGALRLAAILHALMLSPLAYIPYASAELGLSWLYFVGLSLVAVVLIVEHSLVSARDLSHINQAFFVANSIISMILLIVGVIDAWFI